MKKFFLSFLIILITTSMAQGRYDVDASVKRMRFSEKPWVDITHVLYGAVAGSGSDVSAINDANDAADNGGYVYFPAGIWHIDSAVIISNPVMMAPGAVLTEDGTATLTFNKEFNAGLYQVFDGFDDGDIVFGEGAVKEIYPHWWGATGWAGNDNTAAIQAAVAACRASDSCLTLTFPAGNYGIASQIDINDISIQGAGSGAYGTTFTVLPGFSDDSVFLINGDEVGGVGGFNHRDFRIYGDAKGDVGIEIKGLVYPGIFQNIDVGWMGGDGWYIHGPDGYVPELITFINTAGSLCAGNGITIAAGISLEFINPVWQGNDKSGLNVTSAIQAVKNLRIRGSWVEGVATTSGHGMYIHGASRVHITGGRVSSYGDAAGDICHGIFLDSVQLAKIEAVNIGDVTKEGSEKLHIVGGKWNTIWRSDTGEISVGGDVFFDTDTLYVDSTNNLIGIGTTSPNSTLELESTTTSPDVMIHRNQDMTDGQVIGEYRFRTKDTIVATITGLVEGTSENAGDMQFQTATGGALSPKMTILNDGRVGIGTTSPGGKLWIQAASGQILDLRDGDGKSHFRVDFTGTTINEDSKDLDFRVESDNNANALFVQGSDGNVGIGTTSPTNALEIVDTASVESIVSTYADSANSQAILRLRSADGTEASPALIDDGDRIGQLAFSGHDGSGWHEGAYIRAVVDGTTSDGDDMPTELVFATTADGAGSSTERMVIKNDGSIGIGTTDPNASLDIGGGHEDSIDGTDDILIKDDIEVDGNAYVEGTMEAATITEGGVAVYNDNEMDEFSELNTIVADKTLVNEEDTVRWDAAHEFRDRVYISNTSHANQELIQAANYGFDLSTGVTKRAAYIAAWADTHGADDLYALYFIAYAGEDGVNHTGWIAGIRGTVQMMSTSTVRALFGSDCQVKGNDTGTVTEAICAYTKGYFGGGIAGTFTEAINFKSAGFDAEDGTITDAYHFKSSAHRVDTGTLTNAYGIWLDEEAAAATNNYGIVLDGDSLGSGVILGAGQDATIHYDGADLVFDSQLVGAGDFQFNNGNVIMAGTLTVNGDQTGAADHVFDEYDDIRLLERWRAGEKLPFAIGDILNRDRLLRDTIIQQNKVIQSLITRIEALEANK